MKQATTSSHSQLIRSLGIDAGRVYDATVGQRSHILQQLEEAERDARDALFALEMVELELSRETAAMKSALSRLSETLPSHEFEKMYEFAFDQSKQDWENVWKREWVADSTEKDRFIEHPRGPSKKPRSTPPPSPPAPNAPSSPLPPSSPPPPTSPVNSHDRLPPHASPVRTDGVRWHEFKQPAPTTFDGFRVPSGFVEIFGSTSYRPPRPEPVAGPSKPQDSRKLKRSTKPADVQKETEDQRRQIREQMKRQAEERISLAARNALWQIVQDSVDDKVPPVTWFTVFKDDPRLSNDLTNLTNPFAQDDHIPHAAENVPEAPGAG